MLMLLGLCDGSWNGYGIARVLLRLRISVSASDNSACRSATSGGTRASVKYGTRALCSWPRHS